MNAAICPRTIAAANASFLQGWLFSRPISATDLIAAAESTPDTWTEELLGDLASPA